MMRCLAFNHMWSRKIGAIKPYENRSKDEQILVEVMIERRGNTNNPIWTTMSNGYRRM